MAVSNFNVSTDTTLKQQADAIFTELGMNTSTAINLFLRACVRENGLPFNLQLDIPNSETVAAIEEGRNIASDPHAKGYHSIEDLRAALEA